MTMQAIAIPVMPTDQATVSEADAHRVACAYVAEHVDAAFEVVDGAQYDSRSLGRSIWRFFLRGQHGPVGAIRVDAQTGAVIGLTDDEIRVIHEKAAILAARKRGVLPVDAQGYVLGEYARRQAEGYLGDQIGMFFNATDPLFVPGDPPRWQVTIVFKRYQLGPFVLGVVDVDAQTGEPIPLSKAHLNRIGERVHDLVAFRTSPAAA